MSAPAYKPNNKSGLSAQLIGLVEKGDLEKIKIWVRQTNLKNRDFIDEKNSIAQRDVKELFYWEIGGWMMNTAAFAGHIEIMDYILNNKEFKIKPDLSEEDDLIFAEAKNDQVVRFIILNGYYSHLGVGLFDYFSGSDSPLEDFPKKAYSLLLPVIDVLLKKKQDKKIIKIISDCSPKNLPRGSMSYKEGVNILSTLSKKLNVYYESALISKKLKNPPNKINKIKKLLFKKFN